MEAPRVASYTRVSTEEQAVGRALDDWFERNKAGVHNPASKREGEDPGRSAVTVSASTEGLEVMRLRPWDEVAGRFLGLRQLPDGVLVHLRLGDADVQLSILDSPDAARRLTSQLGQSNLGDRVHIARTDIVGREYVVRTAPNQPAAPDSDGPSGGS